MTRTAKTFSVLLLLPFLLSAAATRPMLHDIQLEINEQSILFFNDWIELEFTSTGEWHAFKVDKHEQIIRPGSVAAQVLFHDSVSFDDSEVKFHGYTTHIDQHAGSAGLSLLYLCGTDPQVLLTSTYTLFPGSHRLERSASVVNLSQQALKLLGFALDLPGVSLGDPKECVIDVPGPWFPNTYIGPEKSYIELIDERITFHGAPEAGFGFVGLSNPAQQRTLSTWMDTRGEVNYRPTLVGDGDRLTIRLTDNRQYRLEPNMVVTSDPQSIVLSESLTDGMVAYRDMVERTMPLGAAPNWVKEAVILEVYPPYFVDGFKGITKKLEFYKDIGFTCIYLMPHWKGGYSPIDLFEVNPEYGAEQDLKDLVRTAHTIGLKVLFDMVIHGMNEKSPLMDERPELFCKNETGEIVRHPTWRSMTFDWESSEYQQYMVNLVLHDLETYGIDGYRVDAASYKGPNWDPTLPYPAYLSGSAAPEVMTKMLHALRSKKPDAVLLSEVFGPAFHHVCNFVHDNQTEACQMLIEKINAGEATAATYQKHLENVFSLLPANANRVIYTRNHDTSWFYHFNGYTPRFLAFEAINALCGIPEIFTGDPKNGPNPEDDPQTWAYYRQLFALRARHPSLIHGALKPGAVKSSNTMIFAAVKEHQNEQILILISLAEKQCQTTLLMDSFQGATLFDLQGNPVQLPEPQLTLQPFQVLVGQLDTSK